MANKLRVLGGAVPTGGTTGQVLAKASNEDYSTEWVNAGSGGGGVPPLVMTVPSNSSQYNTIGFCPLSQYTPSRRVEFSVEGVTLSDVSIYGITDNTFYESAEQDPETGVWGYTFGPAGLYFIEGVVHNEGEDNTYYTGILYVITG